MRWYEQNHELSEMLNFVESLNDEEKSVAAKSLLNILITECGINLDLEISDIASKNYSYKRWYDDIYDLSSAMEFLKSLPEHKQQYVIKRLLSEVVMSYVKKEL